MATPPIESEPISLQEVMQPHVSDPRWEVEAECTLTVANDFMGGELTAYSKSKLKAEEAYQVAIFCGRCSVRSDCLADALINKEKYGVRGGLSQGQRKPLMKQFKKDGFIDDETWDEAIGRSERVREAYLTASRPSPAREAQQRRAEKAKEDTLTRVTNILSHQPEATLVAPENGSIYKPLAAELDITPVRVQQVIKQLIASGVVEKTMRDGRRIGALKLVS